MSILKRLCSVLFSSALAMCAFADDPTNDFNSEDKFLNFKISDDTLFKIIIVIVVLLFISVLIRSTIKYIQKRQKEKRRAIRRRHYHEARDRYYRHHPEELEEKNRSTLS